MTAPAQPSTDPGQAPETPAPPAPEQDETNQPPAGGNVDELPTWAREALQKANREAASYRTKVRDLEPLADKVRQYEDAQKTEAEKAAERLAAAEKNAADREVEALRYRALVKHKLDEEDLDLLVSGTAEEIDARAARLAARSSAPKTPAGRKPQERLRGGGDPEQDPEVDPNKAADAIRARNRF